MSAQQTEQQKSQRKKRSGGGINLPQILAGGAGAAVAAIIGGQLGVAGTVIGAALISVVSGIVVPLIRKPLEKSSEKLKSLVPGHTPDGTLAPEPVDGNGQQAEEERTHPRSRRRIWILLGSTAATLVLGIAVVFGAQAVLGKALSPGTHQLQQSVTGTNVETSGTPTPGAPASTAPATASTGTGTSDGTQQTPAATPTPQQGQQTAQATAPASTPTPTPSTAATPSAGAGAAQQNSGTGTSSGTGN